MPLPMFEGEFLSFLMCVYLLCWSTEIDARPPHPAEAVVLASVPTLGSVMFSSSLFCFVLDGTRYHSPLLFLEYYSL